MLLHLGGVRPGLELVPGLKHSLPYYHGLFLLLRRQAGVPGGIGQTVAMPYNLRPVNAHRKIQVAHHAADNGKLLVILLSENGVRGLYQVEQFGKHRADTGKMPRAGRTAQCCGQKAFFHGNAAFSGIHFFRSRGKHIIHACTFAHLQILFRSPGISLKVGGIVKLDRIDENTGNHHAILPGQLARLFQQSAVSGVEGPHCGDENHMVMFAVVLEEGSPQLGLGGKCLHAPKVAP